MTYHEKDIEYLDTLPKTWTSRRHYGWDHRRSEWYKRGWNTFTNNLRVVKLHKYVDQSIDTIVTKYLHRVPSHIRSIEYLLDRILGIHTDQYFNRRYVSNYYVRLGDYYYIDDNNILRYVPRKVKPNTTPKYLRIRKFYEDRAKSRKFDREKERATAENLALILPWKEQERKRKAKQLEIQKLVQHGFDPELSFRNHKTT